jgi:serine/threonine protein kinase
MIGKYPIARRLGQGGMCSVYLGRHPGLGLDVAIKILRSDWVGNDSQVQRFFQEAQMISQLDHLNIVRIYDIDESGGRPYLVQEYVDGGDLKGLLASRHGGILETGEALRIVEGVGAALSEAAQLGIVHRDIKPANILLTRDLKPKLTDFGIAKQFGRSDFAGTPALTEANMSLGTMLFTAPEQLLNSSQVDVRSDIYSLGVTFYLMVTGELPFAALNPQEMLVRHRHETVANPADSNAAISAGMVRVILKMMAKAPEDRHQSPEELLRDLKTVRPTRPWPFKSYGLLLLVMLGLALGLGPENTPTQIPSLGSAERFLAQGDWQGARPILEETAKAQTDNARLFYALGLCYLNEKRADDVSNTIVKLAKLPQGSEYARHLQVLLLIDQGKLAEATQVIDETRHGATHKLPFLLSRGMIMIKQQELDQAEGLLNQAVQEAGFFDFQRLRAVDTLGKLFMVQGQPQKAASLYAKNLDGPQTKEAVPPTLYTNYAIALMNSGAEDKAKQTLNLALKIHPQDEMALYLQKRSSEATRQAQSQAFAETMATINELSQQVAKADKPSAHWHTPAFILVFLPMEGALAVSKAQLEGESWSDGIARTIQAAGTFPVVERQHLGHVLRELKLGSSELSAEAVRLHLGRLWPASVLVQPSLAGMGDDSHLQLKLVDVQTSEIIAILDRPIARHTEREQGIQSLTQDLIEQLREHFPLAGSIAYAEKARVEIDLGSSHGLQKGQLLNVYPKTKAPAIRHLQSQPPLTQLRVTELDRFTATAKLTVPVTRDLVDGLQAGMLVLQPRDQRRRP